MSDAIEISAKTGLNVEKVLEAIVERIPAPEDHSKEPLRCLIFDSISILIRALLPMSG